MSNLTEEISKGWADRQDLVVFTTVNKDTVPNSVYIKFASIHGNNKILIADNKLTKTKKNLSFGTKGSVLFITSENKSYQIKGSLNYYKEGELFDDMKRWNRKDLPGYGVAVLNVEEVYSGAEKLI
jgi:uncharacterized protein